MPIKRSIYLRLGQAVNARLEPYRAKYDPLAAKVEAHLTLVFPFESPLPAAFVQAHVASAIASVGPCSLTLGHAEKIDAALVWLPVHEGRQHVTALHRQLYTGPLKAFQCPLREFVPHVTIARCTGVLLETALAEAGQLPAPWPLSADEIVVETIDAADYSTTESVDRLGRFPA